MWLRGSWLLLVHSISEIHCAHGQFSLLCRRRIYLTKIHFCFLESFSVAFDSGLWPLAFSFWVTVFLSIRYFYSWVACCIWLPIYRNLGAQGLFFPFWIVSVSLVQVDVTPINAILFKTLLFSMNLVEVHTIRPKNKTKNKKTLHRSLWERYLSTLGCRQDLVTALFEVLLSSDEVWDIPLHIFLSL